MKVLKTYTDKIKMKKKSFEIALCLNQKTNHAVSMEIEINQ